MGNGRGRFPKFSRCHPQYRISYEPTIIPKAKERLLAHKSPNKSMYFSVKAFQCLRNICRWTRSNERNAHKLVAFCRFWPSLSPDIKLHSRKDIIDQSFSNWQTARGSSWKSSGNCFRKTLNSKSTNILSLSHTLFSYWFLFCALFVPRSWRSALVEWNTRPRKKSAWYAFSMTKQNMIFFMINNCVTGRLLKAYCAYNQCVRGWERFPPERKPSENEHFARHEHHGWLAASVVSSAQMEVWPFEWLQFNRVALMV